MTRRDYEFIADVLRKARESIESAPNEPRSGGTKDATSDALRGWRTTVNDFANRLYMANPKHFDTDRFLKAAGV